MIQVSLPKPVRDELALIPFKEIRPGVFRHDLLLAHGIDVREMRRNCGDCHEPEPMLFSVHKDLWAAHGNGGILCLPCFEKRLGRPITMDDLPEKGDTNRLMVSRAFPAKE